MFSNQFWHLPAVKPKRKFSLLDVVWGVSSNQNTNSTHWEPITSLDAWCICAISSKKKSPFQLVCHLLSHDSLSEQNRNWHSMRNFVGKSYSYTSLRLNKQYITLAICWLIISLFFSASEAFDATYPTNVVVTSEGTCTYIPPGIFMSSCPIDITWFPFDDQNCEMKFGSWTYNGFKVCTWWC